MESWSSWVTSLSRLRFLLTRCWSYIASSLGNGQCQDPGTSQVASLIPHKIIRPRNLDFTTECCLWGQLLMLQNFVDCYLLCVEGKYLFSALWIFLLRSTRCWGWPLLSFYPRTSQTCPRWASHWAEGTHLSGKKYKLLFCLYEYNLIIYPRMCKWHWPWHLGAFWTWMMTQWRGSKPEGWRVYNHKGQGMLIPACGS